MVTTAAMTLAISLTAASAQDLVVTNYPDTKVLTYPLALLRGTAPADATSVTVTNTHSTRPATQVMTGLARDGEFRALADLVPGQNRLVITAGASTTEITLQYVPQTNVRIVRPMLYTLSNGDTNYSTPLASDPQNWDQKLGTMVKLLQTFTAESMHDQGYSRKTFNLPIDPATGVVQTWNLIGDHDAAYYYNTTYNRDNLWSEAYGLIDTKLPNANAKNLVIVGFSQYNPTISYKYAHTALGGGHLGLMGGLSLWAVPDSIPDIQPTFMDGSTAYPAIQGESPFVYSAANEIMGAALHELGHALGRPHEGTPQSIMQRGFDRMYRFFTLAEPNGSTWPADEVGEWDALSAAAYDNHQWLAEPPPFAQWDPVPENPLPEALASLKIHFDQTVNGVNLADFSLTRNGQPVANFQSTASLTNLGAGDYRVNLGSLASTFGDYALTLNATGSGITNADGLPLYESQSRTWTRVASTTPRWGDPTATDIGVTRATLSAPLESTGGLPTTVTLGYGLMSQPASELIVALGQRDRGIVSAEITGLIAGTEYVFRFRGTNSLGETVSITETFTTLARLPSIDVTRPGMPVTGSSASYPSGESPERAIDNLASTKYLNFDRLSTGFRVQLPEARTVRMLNLISANDAAERDPASYTLRGSNDGTNFTTIGTGSVSFPARFASVQVAIASSTPYKHYDLVFPTIANASAANSMQIAEVQMLEYPAMLAGATIAGTATPSSPDETVAKLIDGLLQTKMGVGGNQTQQLTITPATGFRKHAVKGFTLITGNDNAIYPGRSPGTVTLQGSTDGTTYQTIFTQSGMPSINQDFYIDDYTTVENLVACQKYRLFLSGAASGFMQVSELQMFGEQATGYYAWIADYNVADASPTADSDQDGTSNGDEYLFGTLPHQPDAASRALSITRPSPGTMAVGYKANAGRTYQPEFSDDLDDWAPAGPPVVITVTNPSQVWLDDGTHTGSPPIPGIRRFYRFSISVSP
jgi:hypothetical protein